MKKNQSFKRSADKLMHDLDTAFEQLEIEPLTPEEMRRTIGGDHDSTIGQNHEPDPTCQSSNVPDACYFACP